MLAELGPHAIALRVAGLESTALPVLAIGASILSAFYLGQSSGLMHDGEPTGGLFGTAVATMGMLSTAVYVVSFPPANNATRAQTPTEQS